MSSPTHTWTVPTDGALITVYEYGNRDAEHTVLLVHGYPDDHYMFEPMIEAIGDQARVITYDTRGCGTTPVAIGREQYTLDLLTADTYAVIDSVPDLRGPVHAFAHDWGSTQTWNTMADPRAGATFGSFVSVSGPSLDHLRQVLQMRRSSVVRWPQLLGQLRRSWYVFAFHLPLPLWVVPTAFIFLGGAAPKPRPNVANLMRGVQMYRTNVRARLRRGPDPRCAVRTVVVTPLQDPYLSPDLADGLHEWVDQVSVVAVDSGHWWPYSHPRDAAELLLKTVRG